MNIKKSKNADIICGDKDLLKDSDFDPKNIRHRISIVVPELVLKSLKEEAAKKGIGYQTFINQILFGHVHGLETLEERVAKLEKLTRQA